MALLQLLLVRLLPVLDVHEAFVLSLLPRLALVIVSLSLRLFLFFHFGPLQHVLFELLLEVVLFLFRLEKLLLVHFRCQLAYFLKPFLLLLDFEVSSLLHLDLNLLQAVLDDFNFFDLSGHLQVSCPPRGGESSDLASRRLAHLRSAVLGQVCSTSVGINFS